MRAQPEACTVLTILDPQRRAGQVDTAGPLDRGCYFAALEGLGQLVADLESGAILDAEISARGVVRLSGAVSVPGRRGRPWQFSDSLRHVVRQGTRKQPMAVRSGKLLAIAQTADEDIGGR